MPDDKNDYIARLSDDPSLQHVECIITSSEMPLKKIEELATNNPANLAMCQSVLNEATAVHELLTLIMKADPLKVELLLQKNPDLFFKKGQVTNNDGLTFFNVSPYQLILFLCDADMLEKIIQWIPTDMDSSHKLLEQDAEMNGGGADLVKIDRDPTLLSFDELTQYIDRSEIERNGQVISVTYPLLKNRDGIIFYNNNIYHVIRNLEKHLVVVELIHPVAESKEDESRLNELRVSLNAMENNSSRRSTDDEHLLIANTMQHSLERTGIQYEKDGVRYRDTQVEFDLINAYRTYIRRSKEHCSDAESDEFWIHKIGVTQRHAPMWLLERLCENRPFIPLPNFKDTPFVRDTQFWNVVTHEDESIISSPGVGLGFDYALFKAGARRPSAVGGAAGGPWGAPPAAARLDLAAIRLVIKLGMADIAELRKKCLGG